MNRAKADLLSDYLFSVPVALSLAVGCLGFFPAPGNPIGNPAKFLLIAASALLLLHLVFYSRKTFRFAAELLALAAGIAAVAVFLLFRGNALPGCFFLPQDFSRALTALSRLPRLVGETAKYHIPQLVLLCCCFAVYWASRKLWSIFLLFAGGIGLFFYLSFAKIAPNPEIYYLYAATMTALLAKKLICSRVQIENFRDLLSALVHSACVGAAILIVAQFLYVQTDFRFPPKPSPQGRVVLSGFGGLSDMNHFGAPLVLDNDIVLTVRSSADSFYLRGAAYGDYTGSAWKKLSAAQSLDLSDSSGLMWMPAYAYANDRSYFKTHSPMDTAGYLRWFQAGGKAISIETLSVTHKNGNVANLFLPEGFLSFQTAGTFSRPLTEDYSLKTPVPPNQPYTVTYPRENANTPEIRYLLQNDRKMEEGVLAAWRKKPSCRQLADSVEERDSKIAAQYRNPGPSVTERTKKLAVTLTKDCRNDYDKVEILKQYLQKNYTYTLNPSQPSEGEDLVDYFLFETRAGYCAHYASALTVLLRAAGVPARYVCGFVSPQKQADGTFVVTDLEAHAWVEVYSRTLGFYAVDAVGTPARPARSSSGGGGDGAVQTPASRKQAPNRQNMDFILRGGILLCCALLCLLVTRKAVRIHRLTKLDRNLQIIAYYRSFLLALGRYGYRPGPSESCLEFCEKLKESRELYGEFRRMTEIYMRAAYGDAPVEDGEFEQIRAFHKTLRKRLRGGKSLPGRFRKAVFTLQAVRFGNEFLSHKGKKSDHN